MKPTTDAVRPALLRLGYLLTHLAQLMKTIGKICVVTASIGLFFASVAKAQSNPPSLLITASNNNVIVSWPAFASNFVLEATVELPPTNGWIGTRNQQEIANDQTSVSLPITDVQVFFRLEQPHLIPIFQFAVFYNNLLEFTWTAPFTIQGRVHANSDIYTGSSQNLIFNGTVTCSSTISSPAWGNRNTNQYTGVVTYNSNPGHITNVPPLLLPGFADTTSNAMHSIIETPPVGEDPNSAIGQQRFYNKAGMVILVSNSTVTAVVKSSPGDPSPVTLTWSDISYFVSTNINFYDYRENRTVKTTQIDVGKFGSWIATNAVVELKHPLNNPLNILYVADLRSTNSSAMTGVRLTNGVALPSAGLTVATLNPLYILGNYNVPNLSYLGTTNTSASAPAALVSDALTVLSPAWDDLKSSLSLHFRNSAQAMTVNSAILAGIVPSDGLTGNSPYSGGFMNLPRLLENWGNGSAHLWLNTSFVNLFDSEIATSPYQFPGVYYYAPTRHFNFDQDFLDPTKLPPGTPFVTGVLMPSQ